MKKLLALAILLMIGCKEPFEGSDRQKVLNASIVYLQVQLEQSSKSARDSLLNSYTRAGRDSLKTALAKDWKEQIRLYEYGTPEDHEKAGCEHKSFGICNLKHNAELAGKVYAFYFPTE